MDVVCEACGVTNPAGTEFCQSCGAYLAWDRSILVPPRAAQPAPPPPPPPVIPPTPAAAPPPPPVTQPRPVAQPVPQAGPVQPTADAYRPGVATPAPPRQPPPPEVEAPTQPIPAVTDWGRAPTQQWGPAQPAAPVAPSPGHCPACGRQNDPGLTFCSKCGEVLAPGLGQAAPRPSQDTRWAQLVRTRDRTARRAYRRSLPPLYRWRRVIIGVLVTALGIGGLYAVGRHPIQWAVDRYYDLRRTTVVVSGVTAAVEPPTASAPDADPAQLVDLNEAAYTMTWAPTATATSCGGAPGTGVIVLTLPRPTRVRQISLQAGLLSTNSERPQQFRPAALGVVFNGGPCRTLPLTDVAEWQHLPVDSGVPVQTIRIGVDTAFPATDGQPLLSITEIVVRSRPVR